MGKSGLGRIERALTLADVEAMAREHGAGDAWDQLTPSQRRQWTAEVQKQLDRERKARAKAEAEAQRRRERANDRFFEALSAPVLKERAEREAREAKAKKKRR